MALQHAELGARVRIGVILLEMVEAEQGALAADPAVAPQDVKVGDELRFRAVLSVTNKYFARLSTQSGKERQTMHRRRTVQRFQSAISAYCHGVRRPALRTGRPSSANACDQINAPSEPERRRYSVVEVSRRWMRLTAST